MLDKLYKLVKTHREGTTLFRDDSFDLELVNVNDSDEVISLKVYNSYKFYKDYQIKYITTGYTRSGKEKERVYIVSGSELYQLDTGYSDTLRQSEVYSYHWSDLDDLYRALERDKKKYRDNLDKWSKRYIK